MLEISSIKNGIVIDHIQAGEGYPIFRFLNLHKSDYKIAVIMNVESKKSGKKDIIKIENEMDVDLGILGLFSENITVNKIKDEKIVSKEPVILPERVVNVLQCRNPRCISNHERHMETDFSLINREKKQYKCQYCDQLFPIEEVK